MAQREWSVYNAVGTIGRGGIKFDSDGIMWVCGFESGIYKYDGFSFVNFNNRNGLPANSITGFAEDANKNKWFSTEAGLLKYNGNSWTVFNKSNSSLPEDRLNSIVIDTKGAIWVSSNAGLTKFDGGVWKTYTTSNTPSLGSNYVGSLYADKDFVYVLYNGSADGYSTIDNNGVWKRVTESGGLPTYSVNCITTDANGDRWFGSYNGLIKLSGNTYTTYRTPNESFDGEMTTDQVWDVLIDAAGNKWVSGSAGLSRFDGTNWVTYSATNGGMPSGNVNAMAFNKDGNLYMYTDSGFGFLGTDGKFNAMKGPDTGLPSNSVNSVVIGKDGFPYFAVSKYGMMKFDGIDKWTAYNSSNSPIEDFIWGIGKDSKGNLWMPGGWNGITKFDGSTFTRYTKASGLIENNLSYFGEDAGGNVWLGNAYTGLSRFNGTNFTNFTAYNTPGWLNENTPTGMVKTNSPTVTWFTFYNSLVRLSGSTWTSFNKSNTSALPSNSYSGGVTDAANNVWFWGSEAVVRYNSNNTWSSVKSSIPGRWVSTIVAEPTGSTVWIGSEGGLTSYNGSTWKTYTTANGLPDNNVRKILIRGSEKWLLTNTAIVKMEGTTFTSYTLTNSGLPTTSINAWAFDNEGNLWMATGNSGVVKFGTPAIRISSDANLSKLAVNTGELSPAFSAATTAYTVSVGNDVKNIKLTPTVADAKATVKVADVAVKSGESSEELALNEGANVIKTVVTAEDGTPKTYTLTVTRRKVQTIAFDALTAKTYGDPVFNPGASVKSELPVSYSSSDVTVASVTSAGIKINKAGTVTIKANQAGNSEYDAAAEVEQTLTINPASLTITAKEVLKPYGQVLSTASASSRFETEGLIGEDAVGSVTFTYGTGAEGKASMGTYKGQVTPADAAGGTFLPSNYTVTYVPGDLKVEKGQITITASAKKTYGQALNDDGASTDFTVTGLLEGETIGTVAITYGTGAKATDAVATYKGQVNVSAATGGKFSEENYAISYVAGDIVVEPAALSITAKDTKKYYGDVLSTVEASEAFLASGLQNDETVASVKLTYGTGSAANAAAGNYEAQIKAEGAAGGTFTASNYKITYVNGTINVLASPQKIAFQAPEARTYGTAPFTLDGLASSGLDLTYISSDPTIVSISGKTATILKAGTVTITAKSEGDNNYTAASDVEQTLTINPAALTITAKNKVKTYGESLSQATASKEFTVTGLKEGETIAGVTLTYGTGAAAGDLVDVYSGQVTPSGADGGTFIASNYTITYKNADIQVKPAALTLTANDVTKTYGQVLSDKEGSSAFTAAGLMNGETVGSVNITHGTGAKAIDAANVYTAQVIAAAADGGTFKKSNYTITYVKGNITVDPAELSITAKSAEKTYGQTLNAVSASTAFTSSGLMNKETIGSVTISYGTGASMRDIVGVYKEAVIPAFAKGGTFNAANYKITYLNGDITVNQAVIALKAAAKNKIYGEADPNLTYSITSGALVNNDSFSGSLSREAGENVNSYAIIQGTLKLNDNYKLVYTGDVLTIGRKALTVRADNKTKAYGQVNPELTVTYTGLVNGETALSPAPTVTTAVNEGTGIGSYDITVTANSENYKLTFEKGSFTVTKAALTITADNKEKFQGLDLPVFTATYKGFANGETSAVLITQPTFSTTATKMSPKGDYPISISGATAANYAITQVPGVLTVKPGYPTSLSLAAVTIFENQAAGTLAGTLSSTSDDPTTDFSYSLISGSGDTDNGLFDISGNEIRTNKSLNFENKPVYFIRVRTTALNSGLPLDKEFSIVLSNINEQPTLAAITNQTICYTPSQQTVALSGISAGEDAGQSTTVSVSSTNSALFKSLAVTQANKGNASLRYTAAEGAAGTATVTITVTDNGGTTNAAKGDVNTISQTFDITVNALPVPAISAAKVSISKGEELVLTASGGTRYEWLNANGIKAGQNTANLTIRPDASTTYRVIVYNENNCSETKDISIEVKEDYIMVSGTNLVTPNGDGVNDNFVIQNLDMYPNNEVKIFDRAGRLLYSKKNYDSEWNGTFNGAPLAEDTYYYIVDFGSKKPALKGFITIVRD